MKKLIIVVIIFGIICGILISFQDVQSAENEFTKEDIITKVKEVDKIPKEIKQIDDWRLVLVNYENVLPEDFEVELSSIDEYRQFDKRAIDYLFEMQRAMKKSGIYNVWVQSSYRSVARQKEIFNKKVNEYMAQGKARKKAEELTLQTINKPRD